jgi:hypothetical protein
LRELAHLPTTIDAERCVLAVPVAGPGAAARWSQAIASENVEARVVIDGACGAGESAGGAAVRLPCRPHAPDEEIRHVVLACVKAVHAPGVPAAAMDVAAQLDGLFRAERLVDDVAARLRALGNNLGGVLAGRGRLF